MSSDLVASLEGVRLSLGPKPLFVGVDIALSRGDRACLVGVNGAGKSTLMRILAGTLEPDSGTRSISFGTRAIYLAQEPDLSAYATLRDVAMADLPAHSRDASYLADAELESLGLDPDRSTQGLSGGEARRAALARAFAGDADLLLLDEPTNHLDIAAIEQLERRLLQFRGAVLIVSHDRTFLERVSNCGFWLRQGKVRRFDGGYSRFDQFAEAVELAEERELSRLETKLAMEERWLARGVTARRARNEGRRRKLFDMRSERAEMMAAKRAREARADLQTDEGQASGKLVIEARKLTKSFGARTVFDQLSLRLVRGDRLGIVGPNGAGKTTLISCLLGTMVADGGSVRHGTNLDIAYLDQKRAQLDPEATIWETLAPQGGDSAIVRGRPRHVAAYAADFLFRPEQLRQPTRALSGGERNRLLLAATLAKPANVLVLDEPTNDLDIETLDLLEAALEDYDGTVLLVSHDRAFLDAVSTSILGALGDGRWLEVAGGYGDFVRERATILNPASAPSAQAGMANGGSGGARGASAASPISATAFPGAKKAAKLSYKDERRLAELETLLPSMDADMAKWEAELADPNLFAANRKRFDDLMAKLNHARATKDQFETEWLELEDKKSRLG